MSAVPKSTHSHAATDLPSSASYDFWLDQVQKIPTLPFAAMRVNELINDPRSTVTEIAEVLKKDQVLTAKILKLANSSYYAIPGGVADISRALSFLGFNTIAQIALGVSVYTVFRTTEKSQFSWIEFWKHALGVAVCSEIIARHTQYPRPEEAFTGGLLHDIGKLVMNEVDSKKLSEVMTESNRTKKTFIEVETEWKLPDHTLLGEAIASRWGLPMILRNAIRYHHSDVSKSGKILQSQKPMIYIVRLANQLVIKNQIGKSGDFSPGHISEDMLSVLKISDSVLIEIEKKLIGSKEKAEVMLDAYR